jgi:hypothetical protein
MRESSRRRRSSVPRRPVMPRASASSCLMACCLGGWLLLTAWLAPAVAQPAASDAETPAAAAVKICSACHSMQIVTDTPKDYDAWHDTVQSMINRGASGAPAEFDLVMQFLFENVTTVDINHADEETLSAVLHTSSANAEAITARRASRPFKDFNDLEGAVPGLDRSLLESKKRMIFF